jgi:hypothetical protein
MPPLGPVTSEAQSFRRPSPTKFELAARAKSTRVSKTPAAIENDRFRDSLALPGAVAFRLAVPNHDIAPRGTHAAVRAKAPNTRADPASPCVRTREGSSTDGSTRRCS